MEIFQKDKASEKSFCRYPLIDVRSWIDLLALKAHVLVKNVREASITFVIFKLFRSVFFLDGEFSNFLLEEK